MQDSFPAASFQREDEANDAEFYREPRLVTHIDDFAIAAVGEAYRRFLPPDGEYLDLVSSWVSHLPPELRVARLAGLGMNAEELKRNERLAQWVVQDLNQEPRLPFVDTSFDGVVICVSVQYLTRPIEVFREIGRVLRPRRPLIVTYSNRCFPTKAVKIWRVLDDVEKGRLIATYMVRAGCFDQAAIHDLSPRKTLIGVPRDNPRLVEGVSRGTLYTDPLYAVVASRKADGATA